MLLPPMTRFFGGCISASRRMFFVVLFSVS
jgi:hypothetical protein